MKVQLVVKCTAQLLSALNNFASIIGLNWTIVHNLPVGCLPLDVTWPDVIAD